MTLSWVIRMDDSSGFFLEGDGGRSSSSLDSLSLSPTNLGFVGVYTRMEV